MKRKQYTDQEIISGILSNNREVLSFLYDNDFDSLNKLIIKEGGTRKDTEDAFHDGLMVLFFKLQKGNLQLTSSVHTYLLAIARNFWKRKLEKEAGRYVSLNEDIGNVVEEPGFDEDYRYLERRKLYQKHLADMPSDCQRLINYIIKGLSLQEITNKMPFNSIEFTKTKRFRCKVMLIKKIVNDPQYKFLKDERTGTSGSIPRW